ncbi:6-bladed beta-propeller [Verrucomicrobiota bacterium sgz303538]
MRSILPTIISLGVLSAPLYAHPEAGQAAPKDDTQLTTAVTTGNGTSTYQTVPNWGNIPDQLKLGPTHGSAVIDKQGLIYVSTDSPNGFYIFKPDGTLVRTMAPEFSGVHGMMIREENGQEFIYAAHLKGAQIVKLTLDGKAVLKIPYPEEAGIYPGGKGYMPTAVAVGPDGSIFAADGYGKSVIHKFDSTGKYIKTFGKKGKADGEFQACHGIALDTRGEKPLLLVCDRENRRLQHFDLDGNFVAVVTTDLRRPCAVSFLGDNVAVAELESRVAILDKSNKVIATLGDNPDKSQWAKFDVPPTAWKEGIFTAPHGLTYDREGNLYVQDWNKTGRVTKLVKAVAPVAAK